MLLRKQLTAMESNNTKQEPQDSESSDEAVPNYDVQLPPRPRQTCFICGHTCIRGLKRHLLKHTGEKPYMCDKCDYRTVQLAHLKTHQLTHTGEKPFKCEHCDYRSTKSCNLKDHMTKHTGEKPYKCDLCEYRTAKLPHLRDHVLTHTGGGKRYKCYVCDYSTIRIGNLNRHLHTHNINLGSGKQSEKKVLLCDICHYKTDRASNLKRHMFSHSGERPHKCDYCEYRASHKNELKKHTMRHTGEKPHKCEYCEFRTTRRSLLNEHVEKLHADKQYKCDMCSFSTYKVTHWKQHSRVHTFEIQNNYNIMVEIAPASDNILTPQIVLEDGERANQTSDFESSHPNDPNKGIESNIKKQDLLTNQKSYMKHNIENQRGAPPEDCKNIFKSESRDLNQDTHLDIISYYQCNMCDFKTNLENNLKQHALTHLPADRSTAVIK